MAIKPPRHPLKVLRWFCNEDYVEEIEGDLLELFEKRYLDSPKKAKRMIWWDVVRSFRVINIKKTNLNNAYMHTIRNYLTIYFRRLRKETPHYLMNVFCLALGIAVLLYILLYVHNEYQVDAFHAKADRIYRVLEKNTVDGEVHRYSQGANPLADALKAEFPEIEETARMLNVGSGGYKYGDKVVNDRNYAFASRSLFKILDFDIVKGNPLQEFEGQIAATLSETTAKKIFGDENPIGKVIDFSDRIKGVEVIAVYRDLPATSTYQFNAVYVAAFNQFSKYYQDWFSSWDSRAMATWVLFKEHTTPETVLANRDEFLAKYCPKEIRSEHEFYFQAVTDIHLGSSYLDRSGTEVPLGRPYVRKDFVSIILLIGVLVIVIAALNYVNLSSVQALKRTMEAGIRKVNGATVGQLRFQLFVETFITLIMAFVIAAILLVVFYQNFLVLIGVQIPISEFLKQDLLMLYFICFLTIWVMSSLIPAGYYSKLNNSTMLVKNVLFGRGDMLRKGFVVLQYGISICLMVGSFVLYKQLNYVQTKDLGFDIEKLLTLDINGSAGRDNFKSIVHDLKTNANILEASASSRVPGEWKWMPTIQAYQEKDQSPLASAHYGVDANWLSVYGIELLKGQNFSGVDHSDTLKVLVNEKLVKAMGLNSPVGEMIWVEKGGVSSRMQIIGVVEDFHFESLHQVLGPVVITSWNNSVLGLDYFTIKYKSNVSEVIAHIEEVQKRYDPENPAEINFLNERWNRYYSGDMSRSSLILVATIISIIISVLGLFGLVSFTVEHKTKEVGIRKVLGASIKSIIAFILRDYVFLMFTALLIAVPIAYVVLSHWLSDFAYRIELSYWIFVVAFLVVILVSFVTVVSRVYSLAKSNPVKSLRYE